MAISEREFAEAEARGQALREAGYVVRARYDRRRARIMLNLSTGVDVAFPPERVEGLAGATADDLAEIEISPSGLGLYWPRLDADVHVPALLQGVFGSKHWMAQQLGARGGQATSEAKAQAARENGRKGGRPRRKTG